MILQIFHRTDLFRSKEENKACLAGKFTQLVSRTLEQEDVYYQWQSQQVIFHIKIKSGNWLVNNNLLEGFSVLVAKLLSVRKIRRVCEVKTTEWKRGTNYHQLQEVQRFPKYLG